VQVPNEFRVSTLGGTHVVKHTGRSNVLQIFEQAYRHALLNRPDASLIALATDVQLKVCASICISPLGWE
jgi:thiamine pyrophosphate-dependent acetolactate synthase large subunit-like protein